VGGEPGCEATLRFAAALVQDGVSGVTVVVPRVPGVLTRAREVARFAGVRVRADNVGATNITMRFSGLESAITTPVDATHAQALRRTVGGRKRWMRVFEWLTRTRA
jgi:hypothetical protein